MTLISARVVKRGVRASYDQTMDVDELASAFDAADAARAALGSSAATAASERDYYVAVAARLRTGIEAAARTALRDAARRANAPARVAPDAARACSVAQCTGVAHDFELVEVAALDDDDECVRVDGIEYGGRALHVCVGGGVCASRVCAARAAADDGGGVRERLVRYGVAPYALGVPRATLYWCAVHERAHVCDARCTQTYADERGTTRCVLSARLLGTAEAAAYGNGTSEALAAAAPTNSSTAYDATRRRRRRAPECEQHVAADDGPLVALGSGAAAAGGASKRVRAADAQPAAPARDPCAPDVLRFADSARANTFGDSMGAGLDEYYRVAHATVDLLLFSDERAAYEARRVERVWRTTNRRIATYVAEQVRAGEAVTLDTMRALYEREAERTRLYPCVVLPFDAELERGAERRLVAYYAMLVVEFYVGVRVLAARVESATADAAAAASTASAARRGGVRRAANVAEAATRAAVYARDVARRVQLVHVRDVAPCVLDLVQRGYRPSGDVDVFARDALLRVLYVESDALQALLVAERANTEMTRDLKQVVAAARDLGLSLRSLVATQLDTNVVLHSREPIVDVFLRARRARMQQHQ